MATIELQASDGHQLSAYVAEPPKPNGRAVVIIQEIFGVNQHIRRVTDGYARDGYLAIAPALFDRVRPGIEMGYSPAEMQEGMKYTRAVTGDSLKDIEAAIAYAASSVGAKHVGVVGFCFGGTLAWLAATRLNPAVAVAYYGGRIAENAPEKPKCPVMLHFGKLDKHIGPEEWEKIRKAHPAAPLFLYDAGHGFNCELRPDYEPESARLARARTLEFLEKNLAL